MDITPELDLWPPNADSPTETAKIKKLAGAASALGAHGVLFVTAASAFHQTTVGRIQSAFANSGRIVRIVSVLRS